MVLKSLLSFHSSFSLLLDASSLSHFSLFLKLLISFLISFLFFLFKWLFLLFSIEKISVIIIHPHLSFSLIFFVLFFFRSRILSLHSHSFLNPLFFLSSTIFFPNHHFINWFGIAVNHDFIQWLDSYDISHRIKTHPFLSAPPYLNDSGS